MTTTKVKYHSYHSYHQDKNLGRVAQVVAGIGHFRKLRGQRRINRQRKPDYDIAVAVLADVAPAAQLTDKGFGVHLPGTVALRPAGVMGE